MTPPRAKIDGAISRNLNTRMHTDVGRHLLLSGWWPEGISLKLSNIAKIRSAISMTYDPAEMTFLTRNSSKGLNESAAL
jgi:hypothetical protein